MANIIASKCKSCRFSNDIKYGGNKLNTKLIWSVSVINSETDEFENVNYFEFENNSKYKFYSDDELKGDNKGNNTMDNFDLKLNRTKKIRKKSILWRY